MRAGPTVLWGATLLTLASCGGDHVSRTAALEEPIRVESGQFISGTLPGIPPPSASVDAGAGVAPLVSDVEISNSAIAPGTEGMDFAGHVSPGTQTVAVRFSDVGSGFWVVPVAGPDLSEKNFLTWQFTADFAHDLSPGLHTLLFAAVDENGASGTQFSLPLCVDTPVPDNFNVCSPKRTPPSAVLSLAWNNPVDLDLIVETPSGAMVGGKRVTTAQSDGGLSVTSASGGNNGVLDHDSNRDCAIDGIDREDIVWQGAPEPGIYQVWVDLFAACGKPATSFNVSLWLAGPRPDGGQELTQQSPPIAIGELLASQANGGSSASANGLFVGQFKLQ
jgi:hypothetical protein